MMPSTPPPTPRLVQSDDCFWLWWKSESFWTPGVAVGNGIMIETSPQLRFFIAGLQAPQPASDFLIGPKLTPPEPPAQ